MSRTIITLGLALLLSPLATLAQTVPNHSYIEILNIKTHAQKRVLDVPYLVEAPNWSRDGQYLIYNSGGHMFKLPLGGGAPQQIDTGTLNKINNDHGLSPDGSLMAISDQSLDGQSRVYILPSQGGVPRLMTPKAPSYWHGWSTDGKTMAYVAMRDGDFNIFTMPISGSNTNTETQLTTALGLDDGPDYGSDGTIYFNSERSGHMRLYSMRSDGSAQTLLTHDEAYGDWFPHPSPDNKNLVFLSFDARVKGHPPGQYVRLRLLPIGADMAHTPPTTLVELYGGQGTINVNSWSPDSQWIAYVHYEAPKPSDLAPLN